MGSTTRPAMRPPDPVSHGRGSTGQRRDMEGWGDMGGSWGGPGDTHVPAAYRIHVNARTVAILRALQEGFKLDIRGKTELKVPLGSSVPLRTLVEPPLCPQSAPRPPLFTQPPHAPLIAPIFHLVSLYSPIVPLLPHISPNFSINCPPYCPMTLYCLSLFLYHPRILLTYAL